MHTSDTVQEKLSRLVYPFRRDHLFRCSQQKGIPEYREDSGGAIVIRRCPEEELLLEANKWELVTADCRKKCPAVH